MLVFPMWSILPRYKRKINWPDLCKFLVTVGWSCYYSYIGCCILVTLLLLLFNSMYTVVWWTLLSATDKYHLSQCITLILLQLYFKPPLNISFFISLFMALLWLFSYSVFLCCNVCLSMLSSLLNMYLSQFHFLLHSSSQTINVMFTVNECGQVLYNLFESPQTVMKCIINSIKCHSW